MKRLLLYSFFLVLLTGCGRNSSQPTAQSARYALKDIAAAPVTPIRNQAKSGTCWAFGGVSLLESEAIRTRRCTLDLSEMWVVRHAYFEKAVKYVRTRGGSPSIRAVKFRTYCIWSVVTASYPSLSTKAELPTAPIPMHRWPKR